MPGYILRRILYIIGVFFVVSLIMFALYKAIPGDPAAMMIDSSVQQSSPERYALLYARARERLGLDRSLPEQYIRWMFSMLSGNFGYSATFRRPVAEIIAGPMKNTVMLNLSSLILVFAITVPLGIATAVKRGSRFDGAVQVFTVIGVSLPSFLIALLFILALAIKLPVFPVSGMNTPGAGGIADRLWHMALPVLVMTFGSLAGITRYIRGEMIEVLQKDYIRTARAKGLPERVVIYSHAFRNALIPVVTVFTGWFVGIFGGSVIIETIFSWNGIGLLLFNALRQQDFAVVMTMNMFYTLLMLGGNLIMDIGYMLCDPRVRLH